MTTDDRDQDTVSDAVSVSERSSVPVQDLPPRQRFRIEGVLGHGGMGIVHRALDRSLLREVAMKRLDYEGEPDGQEVDRFVNEAQITAQLDHPNIVPLHDLIVESGETPVFVMKLVSGQTFSSYMNSMGPAPRDPDALDDLLGVFAKVCDAMAFAHSRGVVHRDLKAQNVMVDTFGRVYVMDWGLARLLPRRGAGLRVGGGYVQVIDDGGGTVSYMAPEQARPGWHAIGPWTDVFALGAMLYEILTGRPPYEGQPGPVLRTRAFERDLLPPDSAVSGARLPPMLVRIAMRAMAREPAERYASVEELKKDVERFLRGGGQFRTRTFAAGEFVIREGEVGNSAYVITQGRCRAFKTVEGQDLHLREMGPGDVFGEMAVFLDEPRSASVEAIEPLVVREVSREFMTDGLGLNTWLGAFVRALADRFRQADQQLTALKVGPSSLPKSPDDKP